MKQAEKYRKYYEALDAIGCKHVSTPRQIKNGTRVFRLPFKDAWGHDIDFATYKSGYVRRLVKLGYCPCYQINKTRKIDNGFFKITTGPHAGLYRKRHDYTERILIKGNGDRLEYLFNYIVRNFFRAKPKYDRTIDMEWLDFCAKWQYGEFGFNSCTQPQQNDILKSLQ
tara:strand:- start:25 stop:531 length:507 start_codon:yes stop_codon:yes gene_type:complete